MHLSSATSWPLERISPRVSFQARQAQPWHQRRSAKRHSLALQRRLPEGLRHPEELQAPGENGWKIKSETRREPGRAREICMPQTPRGDTQNLFLFSSFFVGHISVYCFGRVDGHTLNKASPRKQLMAAEKQNNEQTGLFRAHATCPRVVILLSFRSHIHPSSGMVICPWHACPAQRGSPGRTNPHRRLCSAPTIPSASPPPLFPSPTLSASSRCTTSQPAEPRQSAL